MKLPPLTFRCCTAMLAVAIAVTLTGSGSTSGGAYAAPSPALNLTALSAALSPSLVDTITFISPPGQELLGTGIIISATGEILTCLHVVAGSEYAFLRVGGKGTTYTAKVVMTVPKDDLALLQIQGGGHFQPALLGPKVSSVGERVMVLGNALGKGVAPLPSAGMITSTSASYSVAHGKVTPALQFSNSMYQGDSGGLIATSNGRVVGMVQEGFPGPGCNSVPTCQLNGGLAIPIQMALSALGLHSI